MDQTSPSDFLYTALFCEENIWHLADALIQQGANSSDISVVFICNTGQQVALFNQKSAPARQPVIWDYHVILLEQCKNQFLIYDFDSRATFPTSASQYFELSFPNQNQLKPQYQAFFRLIDSQSYLQHFSSDRSHMHGIIKPEQFPQYPAIINSNSSAISLQQYIDFTITLTEKEQLKSFPEILALIKTSLI